MTDLVGEVDVNGLDADVLRTGRHGDSRMGGLGMLGKKQRIRRGEEDLKGVRGC